MLRHVSVRIDTTIQRYNAWEKQDIEVTCAWRQTSAAVWMRSSLFWDVTRRRLVIYRCLGTACNSHLQGSSSLRRIFRPILRLKLGTVGCPETSVNNYQSTPHNIPQERRSLFKEFKQVNFSPVSEILCL